MGKLLLAAMLAILPGCVIFSTEISDPELATMKQRVFVLGTTNVEKANQALSVKIPVEGGESISVDSGHDGVGVQTQNPIADTVNLLNLLKDLKPY